MSLARTPPKSGGKKTTPGHYGSDSALHTPENRDQLDHHYSRRSKRKLEDTPDCAQITLSELKRIFDDFQSKQETKLEALISAMDTIKTQNEEIKTSINFLSDKYDEITLNIKKLQQENNKNESYIKVLEAKLEAMDKKSRFGSVEIRNIPKLEPESKQSLIEIVKNITEAISSPIQDSDIRDIYRLRIKDKPDAPIIADFTSTFTKEKIIKSTIMYNKQKPSDKKLNTTLLKMHGPTKPIYVSESLTKKDKHLYYLARVFAKDNNYDSCWTSYGSVFLRRAKNDQRIRVNSEDDLSYAETELLKASAEMTRTAKGLSEQTEFFERRKLQQLKTLLSNFVTIEMTFHAKALELLTVAYQQIADINEKTDLENFRRKLRSPEKQASHGFSARSTSLSSLLHNSMYKADECTTAPGRLQSPEKNGMGKSKSSSIGAFMNHAANDDDETTESDGSEDTEGSTSEATESR